MKFVLSICLTAAIVTLSKCEETSPFESCANEILPENSKYKCQVSKTIGLGVDMPESADKFFHCAFVKSGWLKDEYSKKFIVDKLLSDLKSNGYNKDDEAKEVIRSCEVQYRAYISARNYFLCLLMDKTTKNEFKGVLKIKDSKFFDVNYCPPGTWY